MTSFAAVLLCVAFGIPAVAVGTTAAPPNASVYFISPKNGDAVTNPFTVQFGLTGMGLLQRGTISRIPGTITCSLTRRYHLMS